MNPMQLIGMLKNSGNPRQMAMNIMRQNAGNNPMMQNALQMAEQGDSKGIEQLARNLCREKGINPDDAMNQIRQMIGF